MAFTAEKWNQPDFVLLVNEDGDSQLINLDQPPTLEEAQTLVGGFITIIEIRDYADSPRLQIVMDEEGVPKRKKLNKRASLMVNKPLFGTVLLLGGNKCLP